MKIKYCSYKSGIKVKPQVKKYSKISTIAVESPEKVWIPTKQIKNVTANVVVTKGEEVKIGSRLAVLDEDVIVSPVSGIVEDVVKMPSVFGGENDVVVIKNNFMETMEEFQKFDYSAVDRNKLIDALKVASIVDYDGESLLKKIKTAKANPVVVLNLLSDEPYQTTNLVVANDLGSVCVRGLQILLTILKTDKVIVAVPKNQHKMYSQFLNLINTELIEADVTACLVENNYPVGDERVLTKLLFGKAQKNLKELNCVTVDAFSLCALKRLIEDGLTSDTRPITIIEKNENEIKTTSAWIKMGTSIDDVACALMVDGTENVRKVVAGGFLRGVAQGDVNVGWIYNQKSVVLIKDKADDCAPEISCITCGRCVKACPMGLIPYEIDNATKNKDYNQAIEFGAMDCTKCGCCSFVCPSKRFLAQRISYAKEMILNKGLKHE